jgi:aspartyl-tRNA(Asn)/glutamyl-tRNA(Gln) amidotransferase subunit B
VTATEAPATTGWEVVVGLEVHCELATATKLFCGCRNAFGDEPNTNLCPVCLGLPGSLPVLNRAAVDFAMRLGTALGCTVQSSIFHRKNYFYPDMPKDYQVSQYDRPVNVDGRLELPDGSVVRIERAHLEEDTGKSTHVGGGGRIHEAERSLVDYNRAGVPLLEIVSAPDLRSADQARAYVSELRSVLLATGVSDARMEEGSLRVDANVSVRREGSTAYGTRCEVKNMNSLRSLGRAIAFEASRQIDLLERGERVVQETRHWDEGSGRTSSLRSKEEAFDYRYFPEPDLVPVEPEAAQIDAVRSALPALPAERRARLVAGTGARPDAAALLVERGLDELVLEAVAAGADAGRAVNHAEHGLAGGPGALTAGALAALTGLEVEGKLTPTQAKAVLAELVDQGGDPAAVAAAKGFEALHDDELAALVDEAIAAAPDAWERYRAGNAKVAGAIVGAVMKATKGRADARAVTALLEQKAAASRG